MLIHAQNSTVFLGLAESGLVGSVAEFLIRCLFLAFMLKLSMYTLSGHGKRPLGTIDWLLLVSASAGIGLPFLVGQLSVVTFMLCAVLYWLGAWLLTFWLGQP